MSETMVRTRVDYPVDPILRDELAYQLRIGRGEPRVVAALREIGKAARSAERERSLEHATAEMDETMRRFAWGDR